MPIVIEPRSKASVVLPLPPSVNNLFATVRGRRVKSKNYRLWVDKALACLVEMRKPSRFPVSIVVVVGGKVNAQRDLDNMLKPIGDSLVAAGIIPSDSVKYVARWSISRSEDAAVGVTVIVTPAGE